MNVQDLIRKFSNNSSHNIVYIYSFESPLGSVIGAADDEYLYIVTFEDSKNVERKFQNVSQALSCAFIEKKNKILHTFGDELSAYFSGKLKNFSVPIKTIGSEFQKEVWKKLLELPFGSTQSYSDIAKALGRPANHSRAVGSACGANSHFLVIPCHRIVSSNDKGGFSSGVDRKEWLMQHEKKYSS